MAYGNIKKLAYQMLHATESIIYSAPESKSVEIGTIWLHNTSTAAKSVTIWFPVTGSSGSSSLLERFQEAFPAYISYEISPKVPFVLDGNLSEKITMKAEQSGSVNVIIFGREEV
jgi:hypothetical protein